MSSGKKYERTAGASKYLKAFLNEKKNGGKTQKLETVEIVGNFGSNRPDQLTGQLQNEVFQPDIHHQRPPPVLVRESVSPFDSGPLSAFPD
jgi:hypothetical protein